MPTTSLLKFAYLALLSKPSHERTLYKTIRQSKPKSIVELGVGLGARATRMIEVAQRYSPDAQVEYTGIDLFETRPEPNTGLQLKEAHKQLKATGARVRVIPGDPLSALARSANGLQGTDLLVIAADQDESSLADAWFYVPRMLHDRSIVLIEDLSEGEAAFRSTGLSEIEKLATVSASIRRAA